MDATFTCRGVEVNDWNLLNTTNFSVILKEEHLFTNFITKKTELQVGGTTYSWFVNCGTLQDCKITHTAVCHVRLNQMKRDLAQCTMLCCEAENTRLSSIAVNSQAGTRGKDSSDLISNRLPPS
jgi:hypothetical protein